MTLLNIVSQHYCNQFLVESSCKTTGEGCHSYARNHEPEWMKLLVHMLTELFSCCIFDTNSAYRPPRLRRSWCVPLSTIIPFSRTNIVSAFWTVDNRWAIINMVRLFPCGSCKELWMACSVSLSRDEVAWHIDQSYQTMNTWGVAIKVSLHIHIFGHILICDFTI